MSTSRWSAPVQVSSVFTDEQAQRAQAVRVAREVCESREASAPFLTSGQSVLAWEMLEVAEWIATGNREKLEAETNDVDE